MIVEHGQSASDSNVYGVVDAPTTLAAARAYALARGVVLSVDDAVVSAQLVKGTDYIESKAAQFVGMPTIVTQALSWPRSNVLLSDGSLLANNVLPQALLNALYQLCIEQFNGITLMPSTDNTQGGYVIREKVDVLETSFSERIGTTRSPLLPAVDTLLASLYYSGAAFGMQAIRL